MNKLIKKLVFPAAIVLLGNSYLAAGAGVLPYTFNPKGELIFLLGKSFSSTDRKLEKIIPKKDHWLYGDFAGKPTLYEVSAGILTAVREFNEETAFFFVDKSRSFNDKLYGKDKTDKRKVQEHATRMIKDRLIQQDLAPLKFTSSDGKHSTIMYLLEVDWKSGAEILKHQKKLQKHYGEAFPDEHAEVEQFNWVSYNVLKGLRDYQEFVPSEGHKGRLKLYFHRLIQNNKAFFQNLAASGSRGMRREEPRRKRSRKKIRRTFEPPQEAPSWEERLERKVERLERREEEYKGAFRRLQEENKRLRAFKNIMLFTTRAAVEKSTKLEEENKQLKEELRWTKSRR